MPGLLQVTNDNAIKDINGTFKPIEPKIFLVVVRGIPLLIILSLMILVITVAAQLATYGSADIKPFLS